MVITLALSQRRFYVDFIVGQKATPQLPIGR
jgi:hypothetical protein